MRQSELKNGNPTYTPYVMGDEDEKTARLFGVEIELGGVEANVRKLLKGLDDVDEVWVKSEGGVACEMVTHPASLMYHKYAFPWNTILDICEGARLESTDSGGMHIHVNKEAFGSTPKEQSRTTTRLIYMYNNVWEELKVFSRRRPDRITSWANLVVVPKHLHTEESLVTGAVERCVMSGHFGKNTCIFYGAESGKTVEFRIYKGTTSYDEVMAALELTNIMVDIAVSGSVTDVVGCTWKSILEYAKEHDFKGVVEFCEAKGGKLCPA